MYDVSNNATSKSEVVKLLEKGDPFTVKFKGFSLSHDLTNAIYDFHERFRTKSPAYSTTWRGAEEFKVCGADVNAFAGLFELVGQIYIYIYIITTFSQVKGQRVLDEFGEAHIVNTCTL